jgi:transposase
MSDSMARRWLRHFNEGRENVYDHPRSSRPSVVNEDLVRAVEEKIQENRRFAISSLSLHIPQNSRSFIHGWAPKMLTDEHKIKQETWNS